MPVSPSIVEFVTDPPLLGLSISPAQETFLRATYGLPNIGRSLTTTKGDLQLGQNGFGRERNLI